MFYRRSRNIYVLLLLLLLQSVGGALMAVDATATAPENYSSLDNLHCAAAGHHSDDSRPHDASGDSCKLCSTCQGPGYLAITTRQPAMTLHPRGDYRPRDTHLQPSAVLPDIYRPPIV